MRFSLECSCRSSELVEELLGLDNFRRFDLALLSGYTSSKVELNECVARGGHVCRFRFTPRT
jgi:hypothetical protein